MRHAAARYTATLDHQDVGWLAAADCITEDGFLRSLAGTNNAFTQQALNMGWHLRLRTDAENEALAAPGFARILPAKLECFSDRLEFAGST